MWFNIFQKVGIFKCVCQIIIKGSSHVDTPFIQRNRVRETIQHYINKRFSAFIVVLHFTVTVESSITNMTQHISLLMRTLYPTLMYLYCCSTFHRHCRVFYNEHDSTYIITNTYYISYINISLLLFYISQSLQGLL